MKTWRVEMLFVAGVLLLCNMIVGPPKGLELLAALAVLLSFGHAQIADRLAEKEEERSVPEVECYKICGITLLEKNCAGAYSFF